MKLRKKLTVDDLKKISKIEVIDWSEYQTGKTVTFKWVYSDYSPSTKKIKWVEHQTWTAYGKIEKEKETKGSCLGSKALRRINASVEFQKKPYDTSVYTVTYERA